MWVCSSTKELEEEIRRIWRQKKTKLIFNFFDVVVLKFIS